MFASKRWLFLIFVLLINSTVYSQYRRHNSSKFSEGLSVTGKGGVNMFYGDLVDKSRTSYSFGLNVDREMDKLFTMRTQFVFGAMKGKQFSQLEEHTDEVFAHFKNHYFEWTFGGTYRLLNHIMGYYKERTFQPYALLHLGITYYNTKEYIGEGWITQGYPIASDNVVHNNWDAKMYQKWDELKPKSDDVWRAPSGIAFIAGFGGGTAIWISPRVKANIEFYGNYCFSDKIDGHDTWFTYPSLEIQKTKSNDFYYIATLGVTYVINDSRFRNDFKYNKVTYYKNRGYFQKKFKKSSSYR